MSKTEQCAEIIKSFLDSQKGKVESVTLKSGTVRKWKGIDASCESTDSGMICAVMKNAVKFYGGEILCEATDSATLEIKYILHCSDSGVVLCTKWQSTETDGTLTDNTDARIKDFFENHAVLSIRTATKRLCCRSHRKQGFRTGGAHESGRILAF